MSARSAIVNALQNRFIDNIPSLYGNVFNKNLTFDEITDYPSVTITPGITVRNYESSGVFWRDQTVYIRIFIDNFDDPIQALEEVISKLEREIDKNEKLSYTLPNVDDPQILEEHVTTEMLIDSVSTDEGLMTPKAFGEISIRVRYCNDPRFA